MTSGGKKRVYIQNFGCQMNDYDVERMVEVLAQATATSRADAAEEADLIVINSCAIREKSEHKVASAAGRLKELKAVATGAWWWRSAAASRSRKARG